MHSSDTAVGTGLVGGREVHWVEQYLFVGVVEARFQLAEAGLEFLVLLPLL